ncbi:MAG: hypothetical protein HYZ71_06950 [Deltaproteobacteria bacterium]|nr:hypothetical protein [Deltaproteobacteria bacterium]
MKIIFCAVMMAVLPAFEALAEGHDTTSVSLSGRELGDTVIRITNGGQGPKNASERQLFVEMGERTESHKLLVDLLTKYGMTPEQVIQRLNLGHDSSIKDPSWDEVAWVAVGIGGGANYIRELTALQKANPDDPFLKKLMWARRWESFTAEQVRSYHSAEWPQYQEFAKARAKWLSRSVKDETLLSQIVVSDGHGNLVVKPGSKDRATSFVRNDLRPSDWYRGESTGWKQRALFLHNQIVAKGEISEVDAKSLIDPRCLFPSGMDSSNLDEVLRFNVECEAEHEVVRLVNLHRARNGKQPVSYNREVSYIARELANKHGYVVHNRFPMQYMKDYDTLFPGKRKYLFRAENAYMKFDQGWTAKEIAFNLQESQAAGSDKWPRGWSFHPGHAGNVLTDCKEVAVGVAIDPVTKETVGYEIFIDPMP